MLSCSTRVEGSGVLSEATVSAGVLEIDVCPGLDPNGRVEANAGDNGLPEIWLVEYERGEPFGLSSDAEKGVSDSDPES